MFFSKKKKEKNKKDEKNKVIETTVLNDHEIAEKEKEKKKIKIKPKTVFKIVVALAIIIVIIVIAWKIESYRKDRAKTFYSALNSVILGNYDNASVKLKDVDTWTSDEKAYIELIRKSKDIPDEISSYSDVDTINEYISVLNEMKEIIKQADGITINMYIRDDYKKITITEVPFDDAIRYANERIEELEKTEKNFVIGNSDENKFTIFSRPEERTIGFFINEVILKGDGDSYYD